MIRCEYGFERKKLFDNLSQKTNLAQETIV